MKIGFVMYFDNCRMLRDLPDAQYAAVMRALAEYAERLADGRGEEAYLEQQKAGLPRETAMALDFVAGSIRRDHRKYQQTVDRRGKKNVETNQQSRNDEMAQYIRAFNKEVQRLRPDTPKPV